MSQNKSVEELADKTYNTFVEAIAKQHNLPAERFAMINMAMVEHIVGGIISSLTQDFYTLLQQERQTSQEREREIVEEIIADYMEALGTVVLPEEVWLWIADINGKYLNKNLKENI